MWQVLLPSWYVTSVGISAGWQHCRLVIDRGPGPGPGPGKPRLFFEGRGPGPGKPRLFFEDRGPGPGPGKFTQTAGV